MRTDFQIARIPGPLRFLSRFLSLFLAIASFGYDAPPAQNSNAALKNVGVEEFDRLRNDHKAITLDVRTAAEYAKGHIPGAVNIDCSSRDFGEKIAALDRSHQYLVHCGVGIRSSKACERMARLNFTNLYTLKGGFKAWEDAGKPIEKIRLAADKTRRADE